MDWIEEKAQQLKTWIRNLSFCRALLAYIAVAAVVSVMLSKVTMTVCYRFEVLTWEKYADELNDEFPPYFTYSYNLSRIEFVSAMDRHDKKMITILHHVRVWCPLVYGFMGTVAAVILFYKKRLKRPFFILKKGTEAIRSNNLDVDMYYDSKDEMGKLCLSFEEMRQELLHNKEEMWEMIESQKKLNAAFAHDLRTPLTVLKGYSDFLARYIPEGKVSEQKMIDTLTLMSSHLERLEQYSRTMKGIRSMEERPLYVEETSVGGICKEIEEIVFALNQVGDIEINLDQSGAAPEQVIPADKNMIIEVLENLLSNAIRYAKSRIWVMLTYETDSGEFLIVVRDDGAGFSKEDLQKAVLPYYREHGDEGEHFGIGLHICSLLCEKHSGNFNIANSMEGGAIATASFCCLNKESKES